MLAPALIALWLLLAVVAGLLIGRGINVLGAGESSACNSPPVTAAKPAADHIPGAALAGPPKMTHRVRRCEFVDENSA